VIGNDTAFPGVGIGKLIDAGCVAQAKLSHIGTNPVTQNKMIAGEIEIDLIPQGTLAETHPRRRQRPWRHPHANRRRHGGGKGQKGSSRSRGAPFLLELPLRADFALIRSRESDYNCNLTYRFDRHELQPAHGFRRRLCDRRAGRDRGRSASFRRTRCARLEFSCITSLKATLMDAKELIARRVALELHDRTLVNLGIGLPTLVSRYVPHGITVAFQSENGNHRIRRAAAQWHGGPASDRRRGGFISALPGAASFDSSTSFALIRGGHLDMTVLGGLQVDAAGHLANWMVPGKLVPGMVAPWTSWLGPSASSSPCSTPPRASRRS